MHSRFVLFVFSVFLFATLGLVGYYYFSNGKFANRLIEKMIGVNTYCSVEVISNSKVLKMRIQDEELFRKFIKRYVACSDGYFPVGDPYSLRPYKVRILRFIVTDIPQAYKVTTGRTRENPKDEGELKYSYSFSFDEQSKVASVYFNPTETYLKEEPFDRFLIFTLASFADYLKNYKYPENLLLRNGKLEDFNFSADEIGISYEKLI